MSRLNRREMLLTSGAAAASIAALEPASSALAKDKETQPDSLATQLYKSLSEEQRNKVCLPADHERRQFISNWWYIHREHRIHNTFTAEQQKLIQEVFDSLHHPDHQGAVNKQVERDQYGNLKNKPSIGFFGTPDDKNFEFIYTGHHVTRRCNAHSSKGHGFGGAPIFYGHFVDEFHEKPDHPGNPYWYQGKIFNQFIQSLNSEHQKQALAQQPRSERSSAVIAMREQSWPGLRCGELADDQKQLLLDAMARMLVIFRKDDVDATIAQIKQQKLVDDLHISFYGGKYDIGSDGVWDTWQIEGPKMVWYFRGQPHIHGYFHLKS